MSISLNDLCYLRKFGPPPRRDAIPVHPYWPRVYELVKQTARKFGVLQDELKFDASQFVIHAAICYPDEDMSVEFLTLLTEWHMWLWTFDDRIDNGDLKNNLTKRAKIFDDLYKVLELSNYSLTIGKPDRKIPTIKYIRDNTNNNEGKIDGNVALLEYIIQKILALNAPIPSKNRFAKAVREYLLINLVSTRKRPENLQDFIDERLRDSAVYTCLALVEIYVLSNSKTTELCCYFELFELNWLCNALITLSNDIFSYEKETRQEQNEYNWLLAIQKMIQDNSLESAVIIAKNMLRDYWKRFDRIGSYYKMTTKKNDPLHKYIKIMYNWVIGTAYWSMYVSLRYKSPTSPFIELKLNNS